MEINHLKAAAPTSAAALVKPTKETMSKKSKKPVDTVKIRLQHPQEGNDFDVVLVNHEGEPVCNLCEKTFVTMKSLYDHLTGHSDVDWMTFFVPHSKTPTFDNEAKVVDDSMEPPLKWKLTGKRGRPAAAVAADHNNAKVYKVPKYMGYGRPSIIAEPSVTQRQIQAKESEGSAVHFKFKLNQHHPKDM